MYGTRSKNHRENLFAIYLFLNLLASLINTTIRENRSEYGNFSNSINRSSSNSSTVLPGL